MKICWQVVAEMWSNGDEDVADIKDEVNRQKRK